MGRWSRCLAALVVAATAALSVPTAYADPVADHWSSVTVTRLSLTNGSGWLHVRIDIRSPAWNGFTVSLPQAWDAPTWSGPDEVDIPGTGVHCRRRLDDDDGWPPTVYHCGETGIYEPNVVLPVGSYSVGIPVTGALGADMSQARGEVALWSDHEGSVVVDHFPVFDEHGEHSTAEVKVARLRPTTSDTGEAGWTATVSAELDVRTEDRVSEIDILLGTAPWRLIGTNGVTLGYRVSLEHLSTSSTYWELRYRPVAGATVVPTGRVQLTSRLAADRPFGYGQDPEAQFTRIWQYWGDGRLDVDVDDFAWRPEY